MFTQMNFLSSDVSKEVAVSISSLSRSTPFYEPKQILVLHVMAPELIEIIEYPFHISHCNKGRAVMLAAARKRTGRLLSAYAY